MNARLAMRLFKHPAPRHPLPLADVAQPTPPLVKPLGGGLDALIFRGRDYPLSVDDRFTRYHRAAETHSFLPAVIHRARHGLAVLSLLRSHWCLRDSMRDRRIAIRLVALR